MACLLVPLLTTLSYRYIADNFWQRIEHIGWKISVKFVIITQDIDETMFLKAVLHCKFSSDPIAIKNGRAK